MCPLSRLVNELLPLTIVSVPTRWALRAPIILTSGRLVFIARTLFVDLTTLVMAAALYRLWGIRPRVLISVAFISRFALLVIRNPC